MNNDLEQFSEEKLKLLELKVNYPTWDDISALARIALSVKQAKPVAWVSEYQLAMYRQSDDGYLVCQKINVFNDGLQVYTTPQPAHTEKDGWIKCSDDLPDETEDDDGGATGYLVRYENDRVPNGGFNIGVSNCVFLRTHWRGLYSHWMPLPAAPKPESE
ncbi:hypothetical protein [Rahnella bonaserana]